MANIEDKTNLSGHENLNKDGGLNWISQINLGDNKVYDIATHHAITFKDGINDNVGVTWKGLTDLEIVIPNLADIVQTPIEFVGTVGEDETPKDSQGNKITPVKGNLVFITANCNFGGHVCEKGDMAIYDGEEWKVVSGENEVMLVAPLDKDGEQEKDVATVAISTNKQNVLTVAGKTLALTFDANSLKREKLTTSVESTGTVPSKYIKITKDDDNTTIGVEKSVSYVAGFGSQTDAKQIKSTANSLVKSVVLPTLTSDGTWPTAVKNKNIINCSVGGTLSKLSSSENEGDFIDDATITIVKNGSSGEGTVSMLETITPVTNSGKEFLTAFRILDADSTETPDITIPTITASNNTYITGLKAGTDVVVGVSGGTFKDGETAIESLAYGFTTDEADSGEVLSNIESDGVTASVVGNVLNLTSSTLTKKYKTLKKATYTAIKPDTKGFDTGSITIGDNKYKLDKGFETTYTPEVKHLGINANLSWGSYTTSGITVNIPAEREIAVNFTGGAFPEYGNGDIQYTTGAEVIGNVSNNLLDVKDETINSLTTTSVNIPTYTLANDKDATSEGNGTIAVGNPITITVNGTADTSSFVTGA